MLLAHLRPLVVILVVAATVQAQHCGGPCEVPRGADPVSACAKYTLTEGTESANWRYLFNWFWTEDGEQKYRLEAALGAPPLRDFGYRRMFVSPLGNGFLVTGNPYAGKFLKGKEPPLFVFCDPEGNRLVELPLRHALTAEELRLGKCPGCDCCDDVLYLFAQDPVLSCNGCFVELTAFDTNRVVGFFLPLGLPVRNRGDFEAALEEAEWSTLPVQESERHKKEIPTLLEQLGSEILAVRTSASDGLVAKGFLALSATRAARRESTSGNFRARAKAVEMRLRPWAVAGWEKMAIDLVLLARLLSYPDKDVVLATQANLARILPQSRGMDAAQCAGWIASHRRELKWNAAKGQYEE